MISTPPVFTEFSTAKQEQVPVEIPAEVEGEKKEEPVTMPPPQDVAPVPTIPNENQSDNK
ncbi:MAG: hypothetical protein PHH28_12280 [Desulfuromonadaceae bacterium]|nr:hypothetical protein [Desulfuromonadaceae bacterium]